MSRVEMALQRRLMELTDESARTVPEADIDALISALDSLGEMPRPVEHLSARRSEDDAFEVHPAIPERNGNVLYFPGCAFTGTAVGDTSAAGYQAAESVLSPEVIPRPALPPAEPPLPAPVQAELVRLRTTVMLAAQTEGRRAVMLCGAEAAGADNAEFIAAHLSRLLADSEWLKVAFIRVVAEPQEPPQRLTRFAYTFVIRRTRRANLYEVSSSCGPVRLADWLRSWEPARVIRELKRKFDLIVIAAPPVTSVPEVALLAEAVDGVILAATENVTSYAEIEQAGQIFRTAQTSLLGVTLAPPPCSPSFFDWLKKRARSLLRPQSTDEDQPDN